VEAAIAKYGTWVTTLREAQGEGLTLLSALVVALNDYKRYVEFDLIFGAPDDFLYRQKGTAKA
jgi:hypothetical protein